MYILKATVGTPTEQTFKGKTYSVIPVIALVEGVLQAANADQMEFISEAQLQKTAAAWNGHPVVVDHPQKRGQPVSANSPDVLETEQVGIIFNSRVEDKKLKFEAWTEKTATEHDDDRISSTVERVLEGDVIEVSTGFFADVEQRSGSHNNDKFEGVISNIVPDHIAILSSATGACSVEDGCGTNRVNAGKCDCGGTCEKCQAAEPLTLRERFNTFLDKFKSNAKELSDTDKRIALTMALDAKLDMWVWVSAVFEDSVVYETYEGLHQRAYEISEDGSVTLGEEVTSVRPETEFVPVTVNKENNMDKTERVAALIANEATRFNSEDQDFLMSLEEGQLEKFEPIVNETPNEADPNAESGADGASEGEGDGGSTIVESQEPITAEQYLADAPPEIADALRRGMDREQEHRTNCITSIKANDRNQFSDEELEKFSTDALEKISNVSVVKDFSGKGGPRNLSNVEDPNAAPKAPLVFEDAS